MRVNLPPAVAVMLALSLGACSLQHPSRSTRPVFGDAQKFLHSQWQDENGVIDIKAAMRANEQVRRMRAATDVNASTAGLTRNSWTWVGPGNIGGRIAALLVSSGGNMLAASVGGGLWSTTDGGASWKPVDDFMANLAVTALAADPPNAQTIYAGTGEGFGNGGAIRGAGVFKSTDGGKSWAQLESTNTDDWYSVNSLTISADGKTVLAATTGQVNAGGIWRSTDGGTTWSKTADGADIGYVEFHPSDNARAIASTRTGQAVYSTDAGATWSVAGGITSSKRIQLAYARSNPTIVYANVDDNKGELWKSSDGGQNYSRVNSGQKFLGDQGWVHNALWVDPTNSSTLVVGGLDLWRSTDGGTTLTKISKWQKSPESAHGDQKVIVSSAGFNGTTDKTVYIGNDGGVYRTQDIYAVEELGGWELLANNLGVTQFYGIAAHPDGVLVGGTQDNGTIRYSGDAQKWTPMYGGDGGYVAADPTDKNFFYGEYVYLTVHRSEDGGNWKADDIYGEYWSWNGDGWQKVIRAAPITDAKAGTANFIAPFILDPNNPNRMLAGGRSLWTSDNVKKSNKDGGPDWRAIKPPAGESSANNISAIAVAPGNSDHIWVGHGNGEVYRTTNGMSDQPSWSRVGGGTLPGRQVLSLAVDPRDTNTAYATFAAFRNDNVWKTTDGGATWTSASGGLPPSPARSIAINPQNSQWLYLGTEVGIFASENGGTSWVVPHDGPANVAVRQLVWMKNSLVAATFGRGVYKAEITGTSATASARCYTLRIVTDGPGGVLPDVYPNCDNQRGYLEGTRVRLYVQAMPGHGFSGWSGDIDSHQPSISFVVNRDMNLVARIDADVCYALNVTIDPPGSGAFTPRPAPNCGTRYFAGTDVVLKATPTAGFAFGGWRGSAHGAEPVTTVSMKSDQTVTAKFAVPATNDDPATAFDMTPSLTSSSGRFSAAEDTSNASNSASDPTTCEAGKGGKTVWFKFKPVKNGVLTVDTKGSNYDTSLSAYDLESDGDLQSRSCDDDSENDNSADEDFDGDVSGEQLSKVSFFVTAGLTYLIEVGDATEPEELPDEYTSGGDPTDKPEGGLLTLGASFSSGSGKRRAVRR